MGTDSPEAFPADGEGPVREVTLDAFWMDMRPVSNAEFAKFVRAAGYRTESEWHGWSFVFHTHIPPELVQDRAPATVWWALRPFFSYEVFRANPIRFHWP